MSSLIVEVCEIKEIKPHSNTEVHSLEISIVKGWQCIIKKGEFKAGDKVVFIPPDTILPIEVSDRLGVTTYLNKQRVRSIKLKGEPSYGIIIKPDDQSWEIGKNVADKYGATKYEPPPPELIGRTGKNAARYRDTERDHQYFWKYTDMENMRHFPDVLAEGEEIVATEKIHGTNLRCGLIRDDENSNPILMCGSKNHRRKIPLKLVQAPKVESGKLAWFINLWNKITFKKIAIQDKEAMANDWYSYPLTIPNVTMMLEALSNDTYGGKTYNGGKKRLQVELFGEVYGSVQGLHYGVPNGLAFRAFDLILDGKYVDYDVFIDVCNAFGVETVPLAYRGPFSITKVKEISEGQTLVTQEKQMREGVVVKPVRERFDPKIGRVILKFISDEYLQAKEPDKKGNVKVTDFQEQ